MLTRVKAAAALSVVLLLTFGAASGRAADATVEATGNFGADFAWAPSSGIRVATGTGTVQFTNPTPYLRAIEFEPVYVSTPFGLIEYFPDCPGVPSVGAPNWSGTCTFPEEGEYTFYDPAHPSASGVVTVLTVRAPDATTDPATAITRETATLNATVNPRFQPTVFYFQWGPTPAFGHETEYQPAGSGSLPVAVSAEVTGLTSGATYHYRVVAENEYGSTAGAERTFTALGPPVVATDLATDVAGVEAALNGTVNPTGLETAYYFNYGTTTAYGLKTPEESAGSDFATLGRSDLVTGLSPNTTYHFQIVAKNAEGEVKGSDRSFKTLGLPRATTGSADTITPTSADLTGVANAQGQETTYYFNWGATASYGQKTPETVMFGKGLLDVDVGAAVTGLQPETPYHFQLVVHSVSGTTIGSDRLFVTNSGPPPAPPPDEERRVAPETLITSRPRARTHDRTPTVRFGVIAGSATFRCSVDGKPFESCRSPFTAPSLKPGGHRIRVRAVAGGLTDPTPASVSFEVLSTRRRR